MSDLFLASSQSDPLVHHRLLLLVLLLSRDHPYSLLAPTSKPGKDDTDKRQQEGHGYHIVNPEGESARRMRGVLILTGLKAVVFLGLIQMFARRGNSRDLTTWKHGEFDRTITSGSLTSSSLTAKF